MFYDAEGNRTKHILPEAYDAQKDDGEGWGYTYDPENRLKTVTGQTLPNKERRLVICQILRI